MTKKHRGLTGAPLELERVLVLLIICFVIGAVFYHIIEDLSYVDAIYFTAMTLTTVGYGDFAPQTHAGKLFTSVYVFVGVGLFLGCAAVALRVILERLNRPIRIGRRKKRRA